MQKLLAKYNIKPRRIAVAVSGGADSLALVFMAKEQLTVFGYEIVALTVNHGLRPAAENEARYVAQLMQQHGIEHHILTWSGEKPDTGIEEAARMARYGLLFDWCKQNGVDVLMTAHHLLDQAETFLIRLQRGSGLEGLCCMREVSRREGLFIVRPLLYTNPEVMKKYLTERGIDWVQDESNEDKRYLRNKIRAFLPLLAAETEITPADLAATAQRLQSAEDYIESQTEAVVQNQIDTLWGVVSSFKYTDFLQWHPEIKFRVLSGLCRRQYIPRAERVFHALKQMEKLPFTGLTLGEKELFSAYGRIWVVPELHAKRKPSREEWEKFVAANPQYKKIKVPHKARVAILKVWKSDNDL